VSRKFVQPSTIFMGHSQVAVIFARRWRSLASSLDRTMLVAIDCLSLFIESSHWTGQNLHLLWHSLSRFSTTTITLRRHSESKPNSVFANYVLIHKTVFKMAAGFLNRGYVKKIFKRAVLDFTGSHFPKYIVRPTSGLQYLSVCLIVIIQWT